MAAGRKTGGRDFKPGEAPNPKGRPKVAKEFKQRCREWAENNGWDELKAVAENSESPDHWRGLEMVFHYAYGKPTQAVEMSGAVELLAGGLTAEQIATLAALHAKPGD